VASLKHSFNPYDHVNLLAQLADLKEIDYQNTLVITAIVELLVEKGLISRNDILQKTKELEMDIPTEWLAGQASSSHYEN
jgi:hypothetical protein